MRGDYQADPFEGPDTGFRELVDKVLELLSTEDGGAYNRAEDVAQPVRIRALQCILRLGGDPDARGMEHFARGVKIGVGTRMPRTPAIYARKRRWRLPTQADCGFDWESERATVGEAWRDNYQSASLHREAIMEQLLDSVDRGLALRMKPDEAEHHFPGLSINSLGGVAKLSDAGEVVGVRIVMDGTHGVVVNSAIRQRDQDRCPIASDVKRQQREQASTRPARGVALDVQEAHHLPRVHRSDWRHQCCRCDGCEDVFIFTVGCFGISSAAYWWSRLGGALVRAAHLLCEPADEIWLLLMADDLKAESTSASPSRSIIYVVLILLILGVPLAWRKSQGGEVIRWIGYEVGLRHLTLGVTERRAAWCVDYLLRLARDGRAEMSWMRSGLGRLCFVAGAFEWERPFLAPLCLFLSRQPKHGVRTLPLFVRLVSSYLASRFALRRAYPSAIARAQGLEAFRIDASAEGDVIGVGGWLPHRNSSGLLDTTISPWFAFCLDKRIAPWAYTRGQPYRAISALEAIGVLVALITFTPWLKGILT